MTLENTKLWKTKIDKAIQKVPAEKLEEWVKAKIQDIIKYQVRYEPSATSTSQQHEMLKYLWKKTR